MAQFDFEEHQKLEQDFETPFSEPADIGKGRLPLDHPSTDSGLDRHELYDAGLADAAEVEEPE